eukprot:m.95922 g.95922  ORF g.95922 m.95922 type:complete len:55 (+) comp36883_c0_seq1:2890-3054(+)
MSRTDGSVTRRFQAAVRAIQSLPQQGSYQPSNEAKLKVAWLPSKTLLPALACLI